MYCNKCQKTIENNDLFCKFCGNPIAQQQPIQNQQTFASSQTIQQPIQNQQTFGNNQTIQQPIQQTFQTQNTQNVSILAGKENITFTPEEYELLKNYVGKSFFNSYILNKTKTSSFSIFTFLFGFIYLNYRKMYKFGFAIFMPVFIIYVLLPDGVSSVMKPIFPAYTITMSILFNQLYLKKAKKDVAEIASSPISYQQKIEQAKKKGGIDILAMILSILSPFILAFIIIFLKEIISI